MTNTLPTLITLSRLKADLAALGIKAGDTLMLHLSVKSIGWLVGGPDIVIMALLELLGSEGTLMMYAGWEDGPYTMEDFSAEKKAAYLAECPGFDPATSRAVVEWSVLAEILRNWPGAQRSRHPDSSFCAVGQQAVYLTATHPLKYGFGPSSPLSKLIELNGKVLSIGAPLSTVTLLHHAEDRAAVPNKQIVVYQMPVKTADGVAWVEIEEQDSSAGIVPYGGDYFVDLMSDYLRDHAITPDKVGEADSYVWEAPHLNTYAIAWMERNLGQHG